MTTTIILAISCSAAVAGWILYFSERSRRARAEQREERLRGEHDAFVLQVAQNSSPPSEVGQTEGEPDPQVQVHETRIEEHLDQVMEGLRRDFNLDESEAKNVRHRIEREYAAEMFG